MTFEETFHDISNRALEIGEKLGLVNQNICLEIATVSDQLSHAARAGEIPHGGTYTSWNDVIEDFNTKLEHFRVSK